jgi:hypothetical protein
MKRLVVLGALLAPAGAYVACGDGSHVYDAQLFVQDRGCLGTASSIDVVEGDAPSHACDPVCITQPEADGGREVYVGTTCAPYPPYPFDAAGTDPLCPVALAALARADVCFIDGGSEHPLPRDAGSD